MLQDHWSLKEEGNYKCNIDASFYSGENWHGYGCLLETVWVDLQLQFLCNIIPCLGVMEGEAWALWNALKYVSQTGLNNVIFEMGNKFMVDRIAN